MVPSEVYRTSLALLTDFYQLTMAYAAWKGGIAGKEAVFHLSFRRNPFQGGYAVAAGLEHAVDYVLHHRFAADDLAYLATQKGTDGKPLFEAGFLDWLSGLRLDVDVDAMPEGTPVFPHEPILRVRGPVVPCMLLETPLLNMVNFQTLIATKAARVVEAARGEPVVEFGLRRAQGIDGALAASRAAFVGGCAATSNVLAGKLLGIPAKGTHAHSWVMLFDDELEAFFAYARALPANCILLVDTYDSLAGVRHAIEVGKWLAERDHRLVGIRLDSGDLAWLSVQARRLLDEAGLHDTAVMASNELDESIVQALKDQEAAIAVWGVGTRLVTGWDEPALGGVYKLSAVRDGPGSPWSYRVKLSEQAAKITIPGVLQVRRFEHGDRVPRRRHLRRGDGTAGGSRDGGPARPDAPSRPPRRHRERGPPRAGHSPRRRRVEEPFAAGDPVPHRRAARPPARRREAAREPAPVPGGPGARPLRPSHAPRPRGPRHLPLGTPMRFRELPLPPFYDPSSAGRWEHRADPQALSEAARAWADEHAVLPSGEDAFDLHLLLVDEQKDFCLPEGALYVGGRSGRGAVDDTRRLVEWIYRNLASVTRITATLDTHLAFQIFFPSFWVDREGRGLSPHRVITAAEVRAGVVRPSPAVAAWLALGDEGWLAAEVLHYCESLERAGKYQLYLWPPHCLVGGDGHTLVGAVQEARLFQSYARGAQSWTELKGSNPLTENYSVLRPEVLSRHDRKPLGERNAALVESLLASGALVVAGQASSHCVKSTLEDLLDEIRARDPRLASRVYLLVDCMSPVAVPDRSGGFVADFTEEAQAALDTFARAGVHLVASTDPLRSWPGLGAR